MNTTGFFLAMVSMLAWACTSSDPNVIRNSFRFAHEGRDYEIVSIVAPSGDGHNFLIAHAGDEVLLRARDDDQDGRLDTLLMGDLSLDDANGIYVTGIKQAHERGQYRVMPATRIGTAPLFKLLVFTKTADYRHESIPAGIAAVRALGAEHGFEMAVTEDADIFTDQGLMPYRAVVFLNTSKEVLDAAQQAAFERYIRGGGGFAGVHAASDTEYDWPWYGGLVGAYFDSHPAIQTATVDVIDRMHPSTAHLPARWARTDEWYNFRTNPRDAVHVLATLDEGTYDGGTMGADHPVAWCHAYDGGRAWYTAMGHTPESYADPLFRAHLLGGIQYAVGVAAGGCAVADGDPSP